MTTGHDLVGREAELDLLVTHLRRTPDGPSVVVVEGPEGVGKSALVTAAVRRVCGEAGVDVRKAVGRRNDPDCSKALFRQLGVDPDDPALRGPDGLDADLVAAGIANRWGTPRVVIVEEAHAVPPGALAVVHTAVLATPGLPVLVLVARPEPRVELPDAYRIRLGGLPAASVAELVRSRHGLSGDVAARAVWRLTGGVPADVLDLLAETPPEVWRDRHPVLAATRRHRQALAAVRDEVGPEAWSLVQAAAVVEAPAELAALARLVDAPVDAVDPLVTRGIVSATAGHGLTRILFTHPMTALAIRDLSGPSVVRELHGRAAEQVDDEGLRLRHLVAASVGPDPDLAARLVAHAGACAGAGEWGKAASAYVDAARVAADDAVRGRFLVDAVDAYVGAGEIPPAVDLVPELETHPRTARTDAGLGYLAILRGRSRDAQVHLTRAWSAVAGRDSGDRPEEAADLRPLVCARWVLHSLVAGDGRALVEWADRAREYGGITSVHATEAAAIRGLGLAACGRDDEAAASFDAAGALATSTALTQRVLVGRGWYDLLADDPLAARSALESAASADFSHGSVRIALWAQAWLARTLFVLGRWSESLEVTRRAADLVESSGHEIIRPLVHWPAAVIHAYRGEQEEAARHLSTGSVADHEYVAMWVPSAVAHAQVAESQADYAAVIRALDPVAAGPLADPDRDPGYWPWRDIYANALVLTGRLTEAQDVLVTALDAAQQRGRRSEIARAEMMRGRLFGTQGDIDSAMDAFARAEAQLAGLPMPVDSARLRFVRGQVLRRAGRRREADDVIRSARDAYGRLGAKTYIARCDRELKASGVERTRASGIGELTPQEAAVVELVAAGRTNKEVAGELYISVKTVQYHLTRVYAKLGLRSRSELAAHVAGRRRDDAEATRPTEGCG